MTAKNSIQVGIKIRPLQRKEKDVWRVVDNSIQLVDNTSEPYYFDHIFDHIASNQIIFDKMAKHIIHSGVKGFNGTIFAYGQTSSGKTYTMMGDEGNPGVVVLAAKEIFEEIERTKDRRFLLRVGYIEIYNEKIYDLLNKKNQDLKIHETPTGIVSVNSDEIVITSEEELFKYLYLGNKERTVGETNMNERSSRSHAIFRIIIESRKIDCSEDDTITQSILNLVDLAGSERADQTGARGARLKEGGHINKSLLFLSTVIKRLSENEEYISYRDSKLTRILQASLGGNTLTSIICTIKPTVVEETQSTLSFAMRAKTIKNRAEVNEVVSDATMMKRLEREIKELRSLLEMERSKNSSQIRVGQLEQRIQNEGLKIISHNSMHNIRREKEKRRRTWCSAAYTIDNENVQTSILPALSVSGAHSNGPITPHIILRDPIDFQTKTPHNIIKEEFQPGELCMLEELNTSPPSALSSPQNEKNKYVCRTSLTPTISKNYREQLQLVESSFQELQEFTNLEKILHVDHDLCNSLKQELESVRTRNNFLEKERLDFIQIQEELRLTQNALHESEQRCSDFRSEISQLNVLYQNATTKTFEDEDELSRLKEIIEKLQIENRAAINLEYEFQHHRSKANSREKELLQLLEEKGIKVKKLEKSMHLLIEEKSQRNKENMMHVLHSDVENCENECFKCKNLIHENGKLTLEFEKLTSEYDKLHESYNKADSDLRVAESQLKECEKMWSYDRAECLNLRADVSKMHGNLEKMHQDYEQIKMNYTAKVEDWAELNSNFKLVAQESCAFQEKYDRLENISLHQEATLNQIQSEYEHIQSKYQSLQEEYQKKENEFTNSCQLQKENKALQLEIYNLRARVEEMEANLADGNESVCKAIKEENAKLEEELAGKQQQYDELQREYDLLSNQLMDNVQENENLMEECEKLQQNLKDLEQNTRKTREEMEQKAETFAKTQENLEKAIIKLRSQLEIFSTAKEFKSSTSYECDSMSSSGIYVDLEANTKAASNFLQFSEFIDIMQQIELELVTGQRRTFTALKPNETEMPSCKLLLRNIKGVVAQDESSTNDFGGKVHMHGTLKKHIFHIVEIEPDSRVSTKSPSNGDCENNERLEEIRAQNEELRKRNDRLLEENKSLLEVYERTISEMREEIIRLSAELFEKSLFLDKCACEDYQKQIAILVKEREDSTLICKPEANQTLSGTDRDHEDELLDAQKTIAQLKQDLEAQLAAMQTKSIYIGEIENRYEAAQALTITLKKEYEENFNKLNLKLEAKESEHKNECNRLQLEVYEKLDLIESESREHFRQQREWENKLSNYESTINYLQKQLDHSLNKCNSLQFDLQALNLELKHKDENLFLYENQLKDIETKLDEKTRKNESFLTQINSLEREKSEIVNMKNELDEEIKNTQMNLDEFKEVTSSLELEKIALEEKMIEVTKSAGVNSEQHSVLINKHSGLQEEHSLLLEEKAVVLIELEHVKDRSEEMRKVISLLELEKIALEEKVKKVSEPEGVNSENPSLLIDKYSALQEEHSMLLKEKSALLIELEQAENRSEDMKKVINSLELEKIALEHKIKEVTNSEGVNSEKHSLLIDKYSALQEEHSVLLEEKAAILIELEHVKDRSENMKKVISSLELEKIALEKKMKEVTNSEGVNSEKHTLLIDKYSALQEEHSMLLEEKSALLIKLEEIKVRNEDVQIRLDTAKSELEQQQITVETTVKQNKELHDKTLEDRKEYEYNLSKIIEEYEKKEVLFLQADKRKVDQIDILLQDALKNKEIVTLHMSRIQLLEEQLNSLKKENHKVVQQQSQLELQLIEKIDNITALEHQSIGLQRALSELQEKYDSIYKLNTRQNVTRLEQRTYGITAKATECDHLKTELETVKAQYSELELRMKAVVVETNEKIKTLKKYFEDKSQLLKQQTEECDKLRVALEGKEKVFKDEKMKFEGTIACLLLQKENLEAKLNFTELTLKKIQSEPSPIQCKSESANSATEFRSSHSPGASRCADRLFGESNQLNYMTINLEDKLTLKQQRSLYTDSMERRNRRLSTHDERRRQSFWGATRDVGLMTEPTDVNCNCEELDKKLNECNKNLFIRESQVTALMFELKNHPLKAENIALIKRLQEEQEKNRIEIRKYKQIIVEKTTKLPTSNATFTARDGATQECKAPKIAVNAEAQTESDLETAFHEIQGKYYVMKNISRNRYSIIKELEEKIAEKENEGENVLSSFEHGRLITIKRECVTLKKELRKYQLKYKDAKEVLNLRFEEIRKLRAEQGLST